MSVDLGRLVLESRLRGRRARADAGQIGYAEAYIPSEGWGIRANLRRGPQGGVVVDRLHIAYQPGAEIPPNGIDHEMLRRLPFARLLAEVRAQVLDLAGDPDLVRVMEIAPDVALDDIRAAAQDQRRRPGRPRLPESLLREVAEMYLEELKAGRGARGRLAVRKNVPPETARDWIAQARDQDFLTKAIPGKRDASAGPRLEQLRAAEGHRRGRQP